MKCTQKRFLQCVRLSVCVSFVCLAGFARSDIVVTDYLKREVRLNKPAARMVALAPHIVENIYAAGAGGRLVAAVEYSDFPEDAKSLPRVGKISTFSREAILALKPDLVLVWASGGGARSIAPFEALGLTVYADDPMRLEDVARSLRDIGTLTGNKVPANRAAEQYLGKLKALKAKYRTRDTLSTFWEVWHKPLQTLNGQHMVSDMLAICGGRNVFADAVPLAPVVSAEALLARNPEVIVSPGKRPQDVVTRWQIWPGLAAVKHKRIFTVNGDWVSRNTPRLLLGLESVCQQFANSREAK